MIELWRRTIEQLAFVPPIWLEDVSRYQTAVHSYAGIRWMLLSCSMLSAPEYLYFLRPGNWSCVMYNILLKVEPRLRCMSAELCCSCTCSNGVLAFIEVRIRNQTHASLARKARPLEFDSARSPRPRARSLSHYIDSSRHITQRLRYRGLMNASPLIMLMAYPCAQLPSMSCKHHKLSLATPAVKRLSMQSFRSSALPSVPTLRRSDSMASGP